MENRMETEDSEDLMPFPADLPLDIVRLIFEKAVEEHPLPVHLTLVSRQVQYWVEPSIYRHLSFRSDIQFELFYRTFRGRRFSATKPPEFYSRHVKTLYVGCDKPNVEKLSAIGKQLTGLHALAAWDDSWGYTTLSFMKELDLAQSLPALCESVEGKEISEPYTYPYHNLRKLSLSSHALDGQQITFAHRMFTNLTHLDIYFTYFFEWSSLASLHNLTHLSVDMATLAYPKPTMNEMTTWMENITEFCNRLSKMKVISFACVDDEYVDLDLLDDEGDYFLPPDLDILDKWTSPDPWPLCSLDIDDTSLHPWTRMAIGMYHPLVVIGTLTEDLPKSHILKDYLVLFEWPMNVWDWDFSVPVKKHKESWDVAEEIIRMRQGVKERADGVFGYKDIVKERWKDSGGAESHSGLLTEPA